MPAKDREEDAWIIDTGLIFSFGNSESSKTESDKKTNTSSKTTSRKAPSLGFTFAAAGARRFVFESPAKAVLFKLQPTVGVEVYTGMKDKQGLKGSGYNEKTKFVTTDAAGTTTVTSVTTGDNFQHKNTTEFSTMISVPMGLKILPANWKVGFLLGATPSAECKVTATFDRTGNNKTQKTVTTTTGPGVSSTTTTGGEFYPSDNYTSGGTITEIKWNFKENHMIGLTVPFEGGAHLDITLNGTNLGALDKFVIQAFIPLGAPKKK